MREAQGQAFRGWDFSFLAGRMVDGAPGWDYAAIVRSKLRRVASLLDLGTGGGEFLGSLQPLPARTCATEAYAPNVAIVAARLRPLDVWLIATEPARDNSLTLNVRDEQDRSLPFRDESFELVINRHEAYAPTEVHRVLQRGGTFVTEQVGGEHHGELRSLLGAEVPRPARWDLEAAVKQLETAEFHIIDALESFPSTTFGDIGTIVYYLKAVPWVVPRFSVERYRDRLLELHRLIEARGSVVVRGHRFYLDASRP